MTFLAWRLSLCADVEQRYTFEKRYAQLLRHHNAAWLSRALSDAAPDGFVMPFVENYDYLKSMLRWIFTFKGSRC